MSSILYGGSRKSGNQPPYICQKMAENRTEVAPEVSPEVTEVGASNPQKSLRRFYGGLRKFTPLIGGFRPALAAGDAPPTGTGGSTHVC